MFSQRYYAVFLVVAFTSCATSERLLFITNTSVGLDVSVDAATQSPRVLFGYKRTEGVIFPVYNATRTHTVDRLDNAPRTTTKDGSLVAEAFSVIAKYSGGAQSGKTEVSNAQWFATGRAAKTLAEQPGIAGAVTGSPAIAQASIAGFGKRLGTKTRSDAVWVLAEVYSFLESLAASGTSGAEQHKAALDALDIAPSRLDFPIYSALNDSTVRRIPGGTVEVLGRGLLAALNYREHLRSSLDIIHDAIAGGEDVRYRSYQDDNGDIVPIEASHREELLSTAEDLRDRLERIDTILARENRVVAAIDYVASVLTGRDSQQRDKE